MNKRQFTVLMLSLILLLSGCEMHIESGSSAVEKIESVFVPEKAEHSVKKEAVLPDQEPAAWRRAYANYLENFWGDSAPYVRSNYSLIYLDDDNIPELFIDTGAEAGGEVVATCYGGKLCEEWLSRCGSIYIERSGLIYCDNGHMGYYPVYIEKLEQGEFSVIGSGVRMDRVDEDGRYVLDENERSIQDYEWEDETVSESVFQDHIDALFDRGEGIRPERWYSWEEMMSVLQTGACTSAGHRYELIQADVTWAEAQELCAEKGGYLATITSPDEQDTVAARIAQEGMQDVSFYVGYRNIEWIDGELFDSRWIHADGSYTDAGFPYGFLSYNAPDYDDVKDEWDVDHNDCGLVKYYDSTRQIYLFEAPEDLLEISPEYAGKMGYICEFDE